jgi:RHS repeat-associated protein
MYDGWRVIQERDTNDIPTVSYTRGNDLSGSMDAAGGIGGLLARSSGYSAGNWTSHNFYFADGNGNITYMLDGSQAMVASYRYDPFGNTISSSGALASANVYRFSSKEIHAASGTYHYGHRFYDSNLQRWINNDPLGDVGSPSFLFVRGRLGSTILAEVVEGANSYESFHNSPTILVDYWGLWCGSSDPGSIGADAFVPDSPVGFDFGPACENHDHCYGTCGASKKSCDKQFLNDMRNKCRSYQPMLANPGFCLLLANIYYQAVNWGGSSAYKDAQQTACSPCPVLAPKDGPPVIVPSGTTVVLY